MTQDEARAWLLKMAKHMDEVKANLDSGEYNDIGKLNQVAWLGEILAGKGKIVRLALGEPDASPKPDEVTP